jgi:hypothetical protein
MANFSSMITYIAKRLIDPNNTAVSTDDIGQAINDAISYWKFRRFWFNEVNDTATLTAQDGSFPYPDDFLVPSQQDDGFNIQYGNMRYPLVKITSGQYDALFLNNGYGLPRWYARLASGQYQCYPLPDRDYVVGRYYLKDYADLTNATGQDTNDFTDHAPRLIELWALANLSAELRQDDKMEAYYRSGAADEYRNLRVMTNKANGTGKLVIKSKLYAY